MFLLETAIIILFALLLMGLILLNFRDFIEDTTAVELGALFSLDRLWVPLLTVAILFLIGGALPGRIFARIPFHKSSAATQKEKRMETPAIIRAVCRRSFHLRIDVCGDAAILLCLEQRPGIQSEARCRSQY